MSSGESVVKVKECEHTNSQDCGVDLSLSDPLIFLVQESKWSEVENSAVLEQHRFGMQMSLLGQGSPEGFVDHEFPAKAGSIDGLEGPPVRRGQEALMELLTAPERDEDEEDDAPLGAPRCPCGKRGRQGHVQLNGMVAKRPYFRCGNRNCSFLSFGELPSSAEAQGLPCLDEASDKSGKLLTNKTVPGGCWS